jgi:hypothetical protein
MRGIIISFLRSINTAIGIGRDISRDSNRKQQFAMVRTMILIERVSEREKGNGKERPWVLLWQWLPERRNDELRREMGLPMHAGRAFKKIMTQRYIYRHPITYPSFVPPKHVSNEVRGIPIVLWLLWHEVVPQKSFNTGDNDALCSTTTCSFCSRNEKSRRRLWESIF